jgi:hypothetical protein
LYKFAKLRFLARNENEAGTPVDVVGEFKLLLAPLCSLPIGAFWSVEKNEGLIIKKLNLSDDVIYLIWNNNFVNMKERLHAHAELKNIKICGFTRLTS